MRLLDVLYLTVVGVGMTLVVSGALYVAMLLAEMVRIDLEAMRGVQTEQDEYEAMRTGALAYAEELYKEMAG